MKHLYRILILLLCAATANGQYFFVTNFSGTTFYGTYGITVTTGGSVSTGGGTCFGAPIEYWAGPGGPGYYDYVVNKPVYAVRVRTWGINGGPYGTGEYVTMSINGATYALTPADVTAYTECSPGGGPGYIFSGNYMGPVGTTGNHNGGDWTIRMCSGINSFRLWCNGSLSGVAYHIEVDTTAGAGCASNNGPVCQGDTLKLFSLGDSTGATYRWSGPGGFTSTRRTPVIPGANYADSGLYTVIKIMGGIPDTSSTRVVIKQKPVITATSNSPICQGGTHTLNLFADPDSSSQTYSWTGPSSFTSTMQYPTRTGITSADTGIYTVYVVWNGCKDTATTHVVLAPVPPTPSISGRTVYCTGEAFVPFTVAATGTVLWYTTGTGGTGTTTAPVVNTTIGGTYTFWASQTILGCESLRDSITVVVHVTPAAPVITGTDTYCQFFPYVAPTAVGLNILWYMSSTGGVGSTTVPTVNTNIPGVTTFYATQTDTGCESARAPFTVTVNAKPVPPVIQATPDLYCPGQPFVPFTIVSGTGILWYTGPTGGSGSSTAPSVNTAVPGVYTFWASQTVLGCESDRSSVTVTVSSSITADYSYDIKWGCAADTVVFTNNSAGALHYAWDFGDGYASVQTSPTHVFVLQANNTVKLTAYSATCLDSMVKTIDLRHPLRAAFWVDNDIVCQGVAVAFNDSSVGTGKSHTWHFGDGQFSTVPNTIHSYPRPGVYKAFQVVTDFVPCMDTAYHTIYVDSLSAVRLSITDTALCRGTYVTFTGNYSNIGNTGIIWNFGNGDSLKNANPVSYAFESIGTYTVTAHATYRACADAWATRTLTIIQAPTINIGHDTALCKGSEPLILKDKVNAGNPRARWVWNTGATTPAITVTTPGYYDATVTINGCTASASVNVESDCFMTVPNAFTPNGDGINDYFYPRSLLSSGLNSFKMEIFNRWGQLIFATTSVDGRGWDGRLNDIDQPEGVYIYTIVATFRDGQKESHNGNVTLIR